MTIELVKSLFKSREEAFDTATTAILVHLNHIVKGIDMFARNHEIGGVKEGVGSLVWEQVSFTPRVDAPDALVFIGVINLSVGTEVMLGGEKVIVKEETLDYFKRLVKITIPASYIEKTEEEVITFLELRKIEEDQFMKEQEAMIGQVLGVVDNKIDKQPEPDFDWDALTQEQKSAFTFVEDSYTGKKN